MKTIFLFALLFALQARAATDTLEIDCQMVKYEISDHRPVYGKVHLSVPAGGRVFPLQTPNLVYEVFYYVDRDASGAPTYTLMLLLSDTRATDPGVTSSVTRAHDKATLTKVLSALQPSELDELECGAI